MNKRKIAKKSKAKKSSNKAFMFIIFFIVLFSLIGIFFIVKFRSSENRRDTYYTGSIDSLNYAANLLDKVSNKGNNIVFSPFNMNVNMAYLYNGVDNSTRNQMKSYFKKDFSKINDEYKVKLENIKEVKDSDDFNLLYEKYIDELKNQGYYEYSLSNIMSLSIQGKKDLQLLLKKISLLYDRIVGNNSLSIDSISNYTLSDKEIISNDYSLKAMLDDVIDRNDLYVINDSVINYVEVFSSSLNSTNISDKFTSNTNFYNVNIEDVSKLGREEVASLVNDRLRNVSKDKIKRLSSDSKYGKDMVIVNSLYFDYEWEEPYSSSHVSNRAFLNYDGTYSSAQLMFSEENIYLENEYATGFIKNFKDNKYSFVVILPKEVGNFELSSLNIDKLYKSAKKKNILVGLPKFEYQYEVDLQNLHKEIGITELYDKKANMTKMTDEDIYINENVQKISVTIGEKGTKYSNVNKDNIEPFSYDEDNEQVIIDHSFAFLIINNETEDVMLMGKVLKM